MERDERRRRRLRSLGADEASVEELLRFNDSRHEALEFIVPQSIPLADEPHADAWAGYVQRAADIGGWESLRERFVQLRFPIRQGISKEPTYLNAIQMGNLPDDSGEPPLKLRDPDGLEVLLHASIGGRVPVVRTSDREDFVKLVQAFTHRNEPGIVPDSMGACLVSGLNNWDRIRAYRSKWEAGLPSNRAETEWAGEFRRLVPQRELYQDRFLILSGGPYSNVRAEEVGMDESTWIDISKRIRLEHECTHYFTLRVFGRLGHNVLEELIADYAGLVCGHGSYDAGLALRFLGLEAYPLVRVEGRLYNYIDRLSPESTKIEQRLSVDAVHNLETIFRTNSGNATDPSALVRIVCSLTSMSLEEAAAPDLANEYFRNDHENGM